MKTDAQLKKDVELELDWEPSVNAAAIGVEVKDGVITLAGHLDNYADKFEVERAVMRVAGVKGVVVELDVKSLGSATHSDAEIATAITEHLRWDVMVPHDQIKFKVEGGWITLSGSVDWDFQRREATRVVRNLVGVRGVSNLIELNRTVSPADVKTRIEAALERAAHVDSKGITVSVIDGKVTLGGTVHSMMERTLATDAAWAATGVQIVLDRMLLT